MVRKRSSLVIFIYLVSSVLVATAQNPFLDDSLRTALENVRTDTQEIHILNQLCFHLYSNSITEAQQYANKALHLSQSINYKKGIADSYVNMGRIYAHHADFSESLRHYFKAQELFTELESKCDIAAVNDLIGRLYDKQGNFTQALRYKNEALEIYEAAGKQKEIADIFNSIGITYEARNDYDKALENWQKALEIYEKLGDTNSMARPINNLGVVYEVRQEYEKAQQWYQRSLDIDYRNNNKHGIAISYNNLASIHTQLHQFDSAQNFLNKSLDISIETGAKQIEMETYKYLSALDSTRGDYLAALVHFKRYNQMHDSLFNAEKMQQISSLQFRNQIEKTEKENALLKQQQRHQRIFILVITISALLFLLLTILLLISNRKKNKAYDMLTQQTVALINQKEQIQMQAKRLKRANEMLHEKNEEISQQNEQIEHHKQHLEQIVHQRTADLELAKERAEQSDKLKTAFLTNMSHEVRTPLNAITGFANLILMAKTTPEKRKTYVDTILNNAAILLRSINNITEIARIEAGIIELDFQQINVNALMRDLYTHFKSYKKQMTKESVDIDLQLPESEADLFFDTEPAKLREILSVLIENAIIFTPQGRVTLGYTFTETRITFFVKDTGIGISKEKQEVIFDRFRKAHDENQIHTPGSGVGLTIARKLTLLLNGDIELESTTNEGSVFYVLLPLKNRLLKKRENPIIQQIQHNESEQDKAASVSNLVNLIEKSNDTIRQNHEQIKLQINGLLQQWQVFQKKQSVREIKQFGLKVQQFGKEFDIPVFTQFGEKLHYHISILDIENVRKILDCFPALTENLQEIME